MFKSKKDVRALKSIIFTIWNNMTVKDSSNFEFLQIIVEYKVLLRDKSL